MPSLRPSVLYRFPLFWKMVYFFNACTVVVPHLAWPLLFGQNHLRMIQAHTYHAGLKVRFDHPSLKFTITCCDENPFTAFPSLANQNSSQPQGSTPSSLSTVPQPICLLTPMPPPTKPREHVLLQRGFNVVSFCLLLTSLLVGSSFLVEGQEICHVAGGSGNLPWGSSCKWPY